MEGVSEERGSQKDACLMELSREFLKLNLKYSRQITGLASFLAARGKYGALGILYQEGSPQSAGNLSEALGLTPGRVANVLKVLEKEGYIIREKDAGDRRRCMVSLTEAGGRYMAAIYSEAERIQLKLVQEIGEEDIRLYIRVTEKLLELSGERINGLETAAQK